MVWIWVSESLNWDRCGLSAKKRVYESISVLGGGILADFVPQCNMLVCRPGRLNFNFLPTFLQILSALFGIQFKRSCRFELPGNTGQKKIFRKNYPKTCSKHVWTFLGTILGLFGILKNFWFWRLDPPWNTGQKTFSKKLPQNTFKTRLDSFGNDFGQFGHFEIFLIFFWKFFLSLYLIF